METGACGAHFLCALKRVGVEKNPELGPVIIPNPVFMADIARDLQLKK